MAKRRCWLNSRQMLGFYDQLADRSGMIRQYRQLKTILADELGIEPIPETQALYQPRIRFAGVAHRL